MTTQQMHETTNKAANAPKNEGTGKTHVLAKKVYMSWRTRNDLT